MTGQGPRGDQGERGEQGNQGNQGERGELSRPLRRSLVYLFGLAVILAGLAFYVGLHEQDASRAVQQRAGLALERQLCATFGKAAALKPPAGNPRTNPSRAYLQGEHVVWTSVVADLHCNRLSR